MKWNHSPLVLSSNNPHLLQALVATSVKWLMWTLFGGPNGLEGHDKNWTNPLSGTHANICMYSFLSVSPTVWEADRGNWGMQVRSTPKFTSQKEGGEPQLAPSFLHGPCRDAWSTPGIQQMLNVNCPPLSPCDTALSNYSALSLLMLDSVTANQSHTVHFIARVPSGICPMWFIVLLPQKQLKAMAVDATSALREY